MRLGESFQNHQHHHVLGTVLVLTGRKTIEDTDLACRRPMGCKRINKVFLKKKKKKKL